MIHLQQTREEVLQNTSKLQEWIKKIYHHKTKEDNSIQETWFFGGMLEMKKKENMENLKTCGRDPT